MDRAIREAVDRLGRADIMVGIPSFRNAATIGTVVRAAQAGLVQYFPDLRPVLVNSDGGSSDGTGGVVVDTEPPEYVERILLTRPANRLVRVSLAYPAIDGVSGKGAALRTIFEIAAALEVQALVVVDSDLRSIVPEWIELLAGPILKGGYDYVTPRYTRHKHDGTITNSVAYPLTRALYGLRIRQPIGGDFGISGDLVRRFLEAPDWTPEVSRFGIDVWMTTTAITGGYAICEARLGAKVHDPKDPGADLGPMFRQVVTSALRLAVAHAERWQKVRASHPVPAYGFERVGDPPAVEVDVDRLRERFAAGAAEHETAWRRALAPATAEAVRALATGAAEGASPTFPDALWARVVWDLVVHARRDPDDLEAAVDALLPAYLGRVAAFVVENADLASEAAEDAVERQARAFETERPYLLARWTEDLR